LKKELKIIGKEFQKITGKPFLPSPKDMAILMNWLERGVPVNAIIDGIKIGWEGKKKKRATISFFKRDIERAILSYRERVIGERNGEFDREPLMINEIKNFLRNIPSELEFTRGIFEEAIKILRGRRNEAQKLAILEKLENELERILLERFSKEGESPKKVLKNLRMNYKIPRLLRYFY
jgi:hypothetical protein